MNTEPEMTEPIHEWFSLSYSNYLCLPRSVLQSMPLQWQHRLVECLRALPALPDAPSHYDVQPVDEPDPYADYERGRRRVHCEGSPYLRGYHTALNQTERPKNPYPLLHIEAHDWSEGFRVGRQERPKTAYIAGRKSGEDYIAGYDLNPAAPVPPCPDLYEKYDRVDWNRGFSDVIAGGQIEA